MNSRPRIAVVGASARGCAFSLLRAGCEVVAADLFADADLRRVCPATQITDYPHALADWLAETACDGWLYTGALENHPDLIDRMAKLRPLLGMQGDVLRRVRDPLLLQEVVRAAGLNFPETKPCDGLPPGDGDWLHKTGQGGNGSGVSRLPNEPPTVGYFQHFVPGESGSAIIVDGELRGITRQLIGKDYPPPQYSGEGLGEGFREFEKLRRPSPSPSRHLFEDLAGRGIHSFQYSGTLAPWDFSSEIVDEFAMLGRVLSTMGLRGLFGVDFVFDGNRPWIIEVNPRVTAAVEIVERVTGSNLLAEHLASFGFHVETLPPQPVPTAGKVILYAKQPLLISPAMSEQLLSRTGSLEAPLLADIPNAGTEISVGEPILTVFARGETLENVEQDLRRQVLALENELYTESVGRHV